MALTSSYPSCTFRRSANVSADSSSSVTQAPFLQLGPSSSASSIGGTGLLRLDTGRLDCIGPSTNVLVDIVCKLFRTHDDRIATVRLDLRPNLLRSYCFGRRRSQPIHDIGRSSRRRG